MPVSLSVGIPNYNHAHYLERCITAVMTQDRLPDEVIVYDDCSTDNSLEVLAGLQKRWPLLRVVRGERNRGVVAVGNDLAGMAQGEWLVLRAADDCCLPGFYRLALAWAERCPHVGVLCGSFIGVEEASGERWMESADRWIDAGFHAPDDMIWKLFHRAPALFGLGFTTIWNRRFFLDAGGMLPELATYSDEFVFRCVAARHGAVYLGTAPVVCARASSATYSGHTRRTPAVFMETLEHAARLMRTRESGLFPERYVRNWEIKAREELGLAPMSRARQAKLALAWACRNAALRATRYLGR